MVKTRMCSVCGQTEAEPWEICSICGWQDEPGLDLWDSFNCNHVSLWEARMNWQATADIKAGVISLPDEIQMLAEVESVLAEHVPTEEDGDELEEYIDMWEKFREFLLVEIDKI